MHSGENRQYFFRSKSGVLVMALLLLCAMGLGCLLGSNPLSPSELWRGLLRREGADAASIVLYYLRIPRVAAAAAAGVGLSVSGVLLQSVTGNALASPNIIGVNSGAGFFCILALSFFPALSPLLPFWAFLGALGATMLIVTIAQRVSASHSAVLLAGVACTSILNAGISLLSLMDSDVLTAYNAFSVGGLAGVSLAQLAFPAGIIALCLAVSLLLSRRIQLLCLGDALAASLGVRVGLLRTVCLVCASASAAAVVSFAGLLGFVGLVVPHIARKLVGQATGPLLVTSAFSGAILVLLADLLGRILLAPTEIPVGVVMALIGAPFFFILLLKRRNNGADM